MMGVGEKSVPASPRLAFISPPILLCETNKGSEFDHKQEKKVLISSLSCKVKHFSHYCRIKPCLFTFPCKDE